MILTYKVKKPQHHHITTTHAWPSLPINPDPDPSPPNHATSMIHYTAAGLMVIVFLVFRSSGFLFIRSSGFGLMDQLANPVIPFIQLR